MGNSSVAEKQFCIQSKNERHCTLSESESFVFYAINLSTSVQLKSLVGLVQFLQLRIFGVALVLNRLPQTLTLYSAHIPSGWKRHYEQ